MGWEGWAGEGAIVDGMAGAEILRREWFGGGLLGVRQRERASFGLEV
jgi:hypothetical protein